MGDINRVFTHIDGYIDSAGGEHTDVLAATIEKCIEGAKRGYVDRDFNDEDLVSRIDTVSSQLETLGKSSEDAVGEVDLDALKAAFREAAIEAMACRRSVLPLSMPDRPWITLDPRETLFDDEDQYAFAIYDTLADDIAELLPDLEQIACECAWEPEDEFDTDTVA